MHSPNIASPAGEHAFHAGLGLSPLGAAAHETRSDFPAQANVHLPDDVLAELDEILRRADDVELVEATFRDSTLRLGVTAELMREVRTELAHGTGFVVLDRFPVEEYSVPQIKAAAALLGSLVGPVVDQKWRGTRLYEVRDLDKQPGCGERRPITNTEQDLHTDGAWLRYSPAAVGLFCIQQAAAGGESCIASLAGAHDRLAIEEPALLQRLYKPFHWDRQAEHAAGDVTTAMHPVFTGDGDDVTTRFHRGYVECGHALACDPLDGEGREALAALRTALECGVQYSFRLQPGQFQLVNNRKFAHACAELEDAPEGGQEHHLLRLWMRPEGAPRLEG